jgi:PAS domain S-box-containing protein
MANNSKFHRTPLVIGILVFIVMLVLTQGIIYQRNLFFEDQEKRELTNAANLAKEKIKILLNQGLVATNTLSFIVKKYGVKDDFAEIGQRIVASNSKIDVLQLVEGGVITHVYPLAGNESVIGYNILNDSRRSKEAFKTIEGGNIFYAGPLKLKQGGLAVVGRLPIFFGEKYWGFAVVIIKLPTLIAAAEIDSASGKNYIFQLSKVNPDSKKEELFLPERGAFNVNNSVKVNIAEGDWNIYAKRAASSLFPFSGAMRMLGLLFSLVAGLFSWYVAKQPIRLKILVDEKVGKLKIVETELIESEAKFRTLVEQSLVGVFIMQGESLVYVNSGFEVITGYTRQQLIGRMKLEDLIHEDDLQVTREKSQLRMNGQNVDNHSELKILRSDGSIRKLEIIVSTIIYKDKPAALGTVLDITQKTEQSKRIEQAVVDAQEKERYQIGMELHDNVQQILAAASLNIQVLKGYVKAESTGVDIMDNVKKYISDAITELRRLSQKLAPSTDPAVSLADKIHSLVDSMNVDQKLNIQIDINASGIALSEEVQLIFFRIIQEQLNNIRKYADTNVVKITLDKIEQNITLSIADEGKGFDTTLRKNGIGLENMRRRTEFLNGRFEIISSPGNGTKVIVQVPYLQTQID